MLKIKKVFYENKKPLNENSTVLVTGGAGFIGSAVIRELNNLGVTQIDVCDKLGKGDKWLNLRPLKFRSYIELNELIKLMNTNVKLNYDYVFHLGACVNVFEQDMEYLINNNYKFTCDLANKVIENGAKFIYASSASTYGEYSLPFSDDESFIPTLRPLSKYGYSKHLTDMNIYMKGGFENNGIVGLKYSNVFGANEYHKGDMRSMILKIYEQIINNNYTVLYKSDNPIYGDGEQLRDFIYIKDVAKMTVFFATEKGMNLCGMFNV
jgi:ADP-L-glycero-D-manno-heptose 6-epimerase